jgi:integrase
MRTPDEVDRELRRLTHGPVTLERATLAYLERGSIAPNTRRGMRSALAVAFRPLASRPLASLDAPTIAAWIEGLARHLEPTSLGTVWRRLRAIARYAQERGWIGGAPWGNWTPARRTSTRPVQQREAARTVDELVRLVHAARVLDANVYTGLACKILVACLLGLRQGELAGLRWTDVAWGPPLVITIARQWDERPVKAKAVKHLESIDELAFALAEHRERLKEADLYGDRGPVFPGPDSAPGHARAYSRGEVLTRLHIRKAVARAGLPNIAGWSAHSCRDTFVTLEASAAGGDLKRVQARSRHASLASLARYLRALDRNAPASPALSELPGLEAGDAVLVHAEPRNPSQTTPLLAERELNRGR